MSDESSQAATTLPAGNFSPPLHNPTSSSTESSTSAAPTRSTSNPPQAAEKEEEEDDDDDDDSEYDFEHHARDLDEIIRGHAKFHRSYSDQREALISIVDDVQDAISEILWDLDRGLEGYFYVRLAAYDTLFKMGEIIYKWGKRDVLDGGIVRKGIQEMLAEAMETVYGLFRKYKEAEQAREEGDIVKKAETLNRRFRRNGNVAYSSSVTTVKGGYDEDSEEDGE